jgi:hypothetical protein
MLTYKQLDPSLLFKKVCFVSIPLAHTGLGVFIYDAVSMVLKKHRVTIQLLNRPFYISPMLDIITQCSTGQ